MSRERYRGDYKQFPVTASGLRAWAKDMRETVDRKAKELERQAAELEAEDGQRWPQNHERAPR